MIVESLNDEQNLNDNSAITRAAQAAPSLSLIFRPGERPAVADVLRLLQSREGATGWTVCHQPKPSAGCLKIIAGGLTFALSCLAPATPAPIPDMAHWYGFRETPPTDLAEAITLSLGKDLCGGTNALPVIRAMAGLAARLTKLDHVMVVVWHPARCAMAPLAFAAAIGSWLLGGAFPALGLTALFRDADGAIRSEGLAFFTGQELLIEPAPGTTTALDGKIAARLINHLVGIDSIYRRFDFIGPSGEHLSAEPSGNDWLLRVWRKS